MRENIESIKECPSCESIISVKTSICDYCKFEFKVTLTEAERKIPYNLLCEDINNAFLRLESYMSGFTREYESFDFDYAFTILLIKTKEPANYTIRNLTLLSNYWKLIQQISINYEKSDFSNVDAFYNKEFCKDCNGIMSICYNRVGEFYEFTTAREREADERKYSVEDLIKGDSNNNHWLPPSDEDENLLKLKSKSHLLREKLSRYSFFELKKVIDLTEKQKNLLIDILSTSELPYQMAFLDHLGFIECLKNQYCPTKAKIQTYLASILDSNERSVRGNWNALNIHSNENKNRYTAHLHKEKVESDYKNLK